MELGGLPWAFQFHCMDSRGRGLDGWEAGRPAFQFHCMDSCEPCFDPAPARFHAFNSIVWILCRVVLFLLVLLYTFQFHCMDSCRARDVMCRTARAPPFNSIVWIRALTGAREFNLTITGIPFNSIVWIPMHRLSSGKSMVTTASFQFHCMDSLT